MKNRKKIYSLLVLVAMFTVMFSTVAFASNLGMGSDATVDILGGDRFSGAVQWVNKIGKIVDNWFMAFISFVSFFIISASCLRNVLAGAYCVFPKFWDRVDEAHKQGQDLSISSIQQYFTGGAWKGTSTGSITQFLLRLLPNIKVLTDFENAQDPDYKQYFMRAIPQCVVAVFVGVFIYNGYYRDVMIVTSQFGSRLTMNALTSIKPDDILYKLSNISGIPEYPIKGAESGLDYIADTYLQGVVGHVGSEFPDQAEKANKTILYNKLSDVCHTTFSSGEWTKYSDTTVWKPSVSGTGISSTLPKRDNSYSADGMKDSIFVVTEITGLINTEYHKGETWYLYGMVTMTNQGASVNAADIVIDDFVLTLPVPESMIVSAGTNTTGGQLKSSSGGDVTIAGKKVKVGATTLEFTSVEGINFGEVVKAENLYYASNSPSHNYPIIGVILKEGASATLSSASTGITIPFGGSIEDAWLKKKNSGGAVVGATQSSNEDNEDDGTDLEPQD